jgi:hypothetical protein
MSRRSTAYKAVRTIAAETSAEAAPTTANTWVSLASEGGQFFQKARMVFSALVKGNADNTGGVTVWGRQGANIFSIAEGTFGASEIVMPAIDLGVVGEISFYVTVADIQGTTQAVTLTAYIQGYNDDAG